MSNHYVGELVFYHSAQRRAERPCPALIVDIKKSANWCNEINYQQVYYVLTSMGSVEGPLFSSELLDVSKMSEFLNASKMSTR